MECLWSNIVKFCKVVWSYFVAFGKIVWTIILFFFRVSKNFIYEVRSCGGRFSLSL